MSTFYFSKCTSLLPTTGLYDEIYQESKEEVRACVYACSSDLRPADALISYLQPVCHCYRSGCSWESVCVCVCWKEVVFLPISHRGGLRPLWRDKHLEQNESHSPSQPLIPWVRLVSCCSHTHIRYAADVKKSFWFAPTDMSVLRHVSWNISHQI